MYQDIVHGRLFGANNKLVQKQMLKERKVILILDFKRFLQVFAYLPCPV